MKLLKRKRTVEWWFEKIENLLLYPTKTNFSDCAFVRRDSHEASRAISHRSRNFEPLGTTLPLGAYTGADMRRVEGPALQQDDLPTYRKLARREDPFGILNARRLRAKASQL